MKNIEPSYDLIVIGGGPSGMMAAIAASKRGAKTVIIEKNSKLGTKLLSTGHGRCNFSNESACDKTNMNRYGSSGKFLLSSFSMFNAIDTVNFFSKLGIDSQTEDNGRIFPKSNRAVDILSALTNELDKGDCKIMLNSEVSKINSADSLVSEIILEDKTKIKGKNIIIATGGKSYPATGSTGDAYAWLENLGHKLTKPRPALTSVIVKEKYISQLEGLSLKDAIFTIHSRDNKDIIQKGDIIFTASGVSGPAIIDISSQIGLLLNSKTTISIDLRPDQKKRELDNSFQADFHHSNNKELKNYLSGIIKSKFVDIICQMSNVDPTKKVSTITKDERIRLINNIKDFALTVKKLSGYDRAMLTAGGVNLKEVDQKTMRSKLFANLYVVGEMLDVDGPSGGYNLQICWSTGYVAGQNIIF